MAELKTDLDPYTPLNGLRFTPVDAPDPRASTIKQIEETKAMIARDIRTASVGKRALKNSLPTEEWMDKALCTGIPPETFAPNDGAGVEVARKICADCVVREECLEYALMNRIDHGVWGGESERERRRILKSRRTSKSG